VFKKLFANFFCYKYKGEKKTFEYIKMGTTYYPSCELIIFRKQKKYKYTFIIDSGADITIIPKSVGEQMNLPKGKLRYLGGISGRIGYYINTVNLELANKKLKAKIAWSTKDTVPLLLGRKDIFNQFKICFKEKNKKVIFIPLKN